MCGADLEAFANFPFAHKGIEKSLYLRGRPQLRAGSLGSNSKRTAQWHRIDHVRYSETDGTQHDGTSYQRSH